MSKGLTVGQVMREAEDALRKYGDYRMAERLCEARERINFGIGESEKGIRPLLLYCDWREKALADDRAYRSRLKPAAESEGRG